MGWLVVRLSKGSDTSESRYKSRTWLQVRRLTLCMLGNFHAFVDICSLFLISINFKIFKNSFRNTIRVSNSLDPDRDRHSVSPDLGPNCFAKNISRRQKLPLARKELTPAVPIAGQHSLLTKVSVLEFFSIQRGEAQGDYTNIQGKCDQNSYVQAELKYIHFTCVHYNVY